MTLAISLYEVNWCDLSYKIIEKKKKRHRRELIQYLETFQVSLKAQAWGKCAKVDDG